MGQRKRQAPWILLLFLFSVVATTTRGWSVHRHCPLWRRGGAPNVFRTTTPISNPLHSRQVLLRIDDPNQARRLPCRVCSKTTTSHPAQELEQKPRFRAPPFVGRRKIRKWLMALAVSFLAFSLRQGVAVASDAASAATAAGEPLVAAAAATPPPVATTVTAAAAPSALRLMEPPLSATGELRLSIRLLSAALAGAAIGKERSGVKYYHPAGVRTMSLVALGAALFTICSRHGFCGTHFDSSRMASNVASGVGFIGAGVIYHEQRTEVVHGLTTAAAIWISAAVGVACGTGLYVVATLATGLTLGILRVGGVVKHQQRHKRLRRTRFSSPQRPLPTPSTANTSNSNCRPQPTPQSTDPPMVLDEDGLPVVSGHQRASFNGPPQCIDDDEDDHEFQIVSSIKEQQLASNKTRWEHYQHQQQRQMIAEEERRARWELHQQQQQPHLYDDWTDFEEDEARELFFRDVPVESKAASNQTSRSQNNGPAP